MFPLPTLCTRCFSYQELKSIPIIECSEPLVDLVEQEIPCAPSPLKLREFISHGMWVRRGVYERLIAAQHALTEISPEYFLYITYAYRHPDVQRRYFDSFYERVTLEHPMWSDDEKLEYTHHYMAIPEVGGHPAGAAIDITLVQRSSVEGEEVQVDMGGKIGDLSDLSNVPPVCPGITEQQQQTRLLLRHCMVSAGFAPYDFEWWHFSFGDREWACYYKEKTAQYGEILFRC